MSTRKQQNATGHPKPRKTPRRYQTSQHTQDELELAELQLLICKRLQTSLDTNELLQFFHDSLPDDTMISSIHFTPVFQNQTKASGIQSQQIKLRLYTGADYIGQLRVCFFAKPTHEQMQLVETMANLLAFPLRHAMEFQEAVRHSEQDNLTGLKNRNGMNDYLNHMEEAEFQQFSIAIADIDHFKKFNDEFGHLVGDLILKRLGRLLKEELPIPCEGFRFGGEEFIVLMPQCNNTRALEIAEGIRVGVNKLRFVSAKTKERLPKMTISLGVTSWQSKDELENVLMRADQALYEAKNNGRNQVRRK